MEYILSFLLLLLNLIHYEAGLPMIVFLASSTALVAALFFAVMRKTENFLTTCLIMMCYTWQISWINIFGAPTSELQLPWFYVMGVLMVGYAVINVKKCFERSYSAVSFVVFVIFIGIFNIPLLMSKSMGEGLKEYIVIGFFVVILFVAYMYSCTASPENYDRVKTAFIWEAFMGAVCIIFQYIMYVHAGISLFKVEYMPSFSGEYQISCYLLMEDHSCSTIMLGCAVFYILDRISPKNWGYMIPALILIATSMAMTSRRTSTISLIIVLAMYVFLHYKGLGKKTLYIFGFAILGVAFLYYLTITRPVDNLGQLLDDNGRIETYIKALDVLMKNPLGVGYDNMYLASLTGGIVPHNTVIRWLAMGGYPFTLAMLGIMAYVFLNTVRKKMTAEFWVFIYCVVASSFIPDILNGRFFIIPCAMALLYGMGDREYKLKMTGRL